MAAPGIPPAANLQFGVAAASIMSQPMKGAAALDVDLGGRRDSIYPLKDFEFGFVVLFHLLLHEHRFNFFKNNDLHVLFRARQDAAS